MKTLTKKEEIKDLYGQLDHKTNFTIKAGAHFKRSPQSLRVHWFGNFWSIPEGFEDELISLLKYELANQ